MTDRDDRRGTPGTTDLDRARGLRARRWRRLSSRKRRSRARGGRGEAPVGPEGPRRAEGPPSAQARRVREPCKKRTEREKAGVLQDRARRIRPRLPADPRQLRARARARSSRRPRERLRAGRRRSSASSRGALEELRPDPESTRRGAFDPNVHEAVATEETDAVLPRHDPGDASKGLLPERPAHPAGLRQGGGAARRRGPKSASGA